MITNYSDLKTTVANYLGRSDLTAQIPSFIYLAETRLGRQLRTRQMLKTVTAHTTANDATVGLPNDFLEMRDLFVAGTPRAPVSYMSPSAFSRNARADEVGKPVFYTIRANELEFAPKPDNNYTLQMLYYAKPDTLSDTNVSNVFLANAPDALLYGALLEAEPYLMNDARIQVWSNFYSGAVENLNVSDENSEYSGIPLSMTVTSR
jgi:hypothetical protein